MVPESSNQGLLPLTERDPNEPTLAESSSPRQRSKLQLERVPSLRLSPFTQTYSLPVNFGMVVNNLYRSSFPQRENFPYLRKLGLKSILYDLYFKT
jgi:tyrosine-protein phosphatase SIW14